MQIVEIIQQSIKDPEKEISSLIYELHERGPNSQEIMEKLAYLKKFYPESFSKYENRLLYFMGLFYKNLKPQNLTEETYQIFADEMKLETGTQFTPVQYDAYNKMSEKQFFSFSAPTSSGKSYLFRELIKTHKEDMVIVLPSRALIAEYLMELKEILREQKDVLILSFIDNINRSKTNRRIFVVTPERATELFKYSNSFNVTLFLFDEAQLTDEDSPRGLKFDTIVRRALKTFPKANLVFSHPFIKNPEAHYLKHSIDSEQTDSYNYEYTSVGKIFIQMTNDEHFEYFSPIVPHRMSSKFLLDEDPIKQLFKSDKTILYYTSKAKVYDNKSALLFKYYRTLTKIEDLTALKIIKQLEEYIGSNPEHSSDLVKLMKRGVVLHHGSMPLKARYLIEKFIRAGYARICICTSTLLQGINMPFDLVIVENFSNMNTLKLKNLIGRAGRSTHQKEYDYGYVVIPEGSKATFKKYFEKEAKLEESSLLERNTVNSSEDTHELIESIKNNTFNDEYNLTSQQVERLAKPDIDTEIELILNNFFKENYLITAKDYNSFPSNLREKIKNAFKKIFVQHLNREVLETGEQAILSTAITVLLWRIQGKTFKEITALRYAYISERDERRKLIRRLMQGEISNNEYELQMPKAKFSQKAETIPNIKHVKSFPFIEQKTKANEVSYDFVVYDTYDYLDKVISFSLSDPLCAAFELYYIRNGDDRSKSMSNYIRYGTDNPKEIWLLRYGFEFETIEWLIDYVLEIDENKITFKETIKRLSQEQLSEVERYMS